MNTKAQKITSSTAGWLARIDEQHPTQRDFTPRPWIQVKNFVTANTDGRLFLNERGQLALDRARSERPGGAA